MLVFQVRKDTLSNKLGHFVVERGRRYFSVKSINVPHHGFGKYVQHCSGIVRMMKNVLLSIVYTKQNSIISV